MRLSLKERHRELLELHARLWAIGPADDMTGGYVDQHDLDRLLKKPTLSTAISCLEDQIEYWFDAGVDSESGKIKSWEEIAEEHPWVRKVAADLGFADEGEWGEEL